MKQWEVTVHQQTFWIDARDEVEAIDEALEYIVNNPPHYIDADPVEEEDDE